MRFSGRAFILHMYHAIAMSSPASSDRSSLNEDADGPSTGSVNRQRSGRRKHHPVGKHELKGRVSGHGDRADKGGGYGAARLAFADGVFAGFVGNVAYTSQFA